ncbi:radical SAM protein [Fundidesulfovibrio butyratiphilus]
MSCETSSANHEIEIGHMRPPSEAHSLLIRVVRNCPWNRCAFCPAYKGEEFSVRPAQDIVEDIRQFSQMPQCHQFKGAFLQDADALIAPTETLLAVLEAIRTMLPNIDRVTAYARSNTLSTRNPKDLETLRQAGLSRIHVGLESGCDEVLKFMNKGTSAAKQLAGCRKAVEAGFELCCYVMPGLGGKALSEKHALETGDLVAAIAPRHVRLRTCFALEGTPLADKYREGLFDPLDEEGIVREIRLFLERIKHIETELVSDHRINLLLELRGWLPKEYERLRGIIDRFLALSEDDKTLFIAGRRLNAIRSLSELDDPETRKYLLAHAHRYQPVTPVPEAVLF